MVTACRDPPVMARTAVTPIVPDNDGAAVTFTAAIADGHMFPFSGDDLLLIQNTDASPHDVLLKIPATVAGSTVTDKTITVPAGAIVSYRPLDPAFRQPSDGRVWVNYSATTGMGIAVIANR